MSKLKRLPQKTDELVMVHCPISDGELSSRQTDYILLTPAQFSKKYRDVLFRPVEISMSDSTFIIQMNACTNPYCKWFGLPQKRFKDVKNKPSRYRISGTDKSDSKSIVCNPDPHEKGGTWACNTIPLSNWSIADEIARLIKNTHVLDVSPEYQFHVPGCPDSPFTPFEHSKTFYRRGKSTSNSQKWQCKTCRKMTNVLPTQKASHTYHQKRNDVLPTFARLVVNRVPVRRTCEILGIGSTTYYQKLEWLYRKCQEFLERHEQQAFAAKTFDTLWLDTDEMVYFLNNVKRHGQGGKRYEITEEPVFETNVVVSADVHSKYVLRADVAFDWDLDLEDIDRHTKMYKDDHLHEFARKYARLRKFSYSPQKPTEKDSETMYEYAAKEYEFELRKKYIKGLHVTSTYTAVAHYWLIKQMLQTNKWRFISDEGSSISTAWCLLTIYVSTMLIIPCTNLTGTNQEKMPSWSMRRELKT